MAVAYVTLDTVNKRQKWFKTLVRTLERDSLFAKLEGKGTGQGTVVRESDDKAGHTFNVEAVGVVSGAPTGHDKALVDHTESLNFSGTTGYRASYAKAVASTKYEQADTPRAFKPEIVVALRKHWARVYDALCINAVSAYNVDLSTTRTTDQIAKVYNPSLAANMEGLAAILNLAGIGTSSCASNLNVNAFFAGEVADGGGPRTNPPADSYDAAKANPEAYAITEESIGWLYTYAWNRGVPPIDLNMNFMSRPPYILLLPSAAIDEFRFTASYRNSVISGDISSKEMWNGIMRMDSVHGVLLAPFDVIYPYSVAGVTYNTLLRTEVCDDSRWIVVEGILLGSQALATDSYDDFEIREANEDDFGRSPKIGYDIIKGTVGIQRVDTDVVTPQMYNNSVSFIFTMRKWS